MNQSGFDNQPEDALVDAAGAAKLLGVKRATLYSYVSRGWLRALPGRQHREKLYPRVEVERLKARAAARSGHGAVAASAMRFGEPVLDSAITAIDVDGPRYRGQAVLELSRNARFEEVAELLWRGTAGTELWPPCPLGLEAPAFRRLLPRQAGLLSALQLGLPAVALNDEERLVIAQDLPRARALIRRSVALCALTRGRGVREALRGPRLALALARALGLDGAAREVAAVNAALILCADHELNASSFAARVAASAGADLHACLIAGLATFTGPRHGAESLRISAALQEVDRPARAAAVMKARVTRGEGVPGFGHPLYPQGDPRGRELLRLTQALGGRASEPRRRVDAWVAAGEALGLGGASLDLGLLALSTGLGLGPEAPGVIFCIGRMAGWVAHVLEQRQSPVLLRPRARYVGAV